MWHVIVRPARRLAHAQTLSRVAQIAGTMVVAEAPPMPGNVSAVHNGVRIGTNGTHADGKSPNNKQVGRGDLATSSNVTYVLDRWQYAQC